MKRRMWLILGVAVVVLLVASVVWLNLPRRATAEEAALDYLQALESGDVDAVRATGVEVTDDAAAAFTSASGLMSEPDVESTSESADSATVTISYTIAEEPRKTELTLTSNGGRWIPDASSALGEVRITPSTGRFVTIGDVTIGTDAPLLLLPGEYELTAAPADLLSGSASAALLPGERGAIEIDSELRPKATELAQDQLEEHLAECTETAAEVPTGCGIQVPWAADLTSVTGIRYRIDQSPAVTLSATEFHADGGVLVATVTGIGHDGQEQSVTYRTQSWTLRGDVNFTADDLVLSVW